MKTGAGDKVTWQRRQGFVEGNYSRGQEPLPAVLPLKKNKNKNVFILNSKRRIMYSHGTAKDE